jgi:hypothetical protein
MNNWIAVVLIGGASAWALAGCGESKSGGPHAGVCDSLAATAQAATIDVSRSTNSPDVHVSVNCDGSGVRTIGESMTTVIDVLPRTYEAGSPEIVKFLADLDAVGDVSAIPASPANPNIALSECAKSVSFGTITTITAQGKTSGDMQCLKNPTPAQSALADDCKVLAPWP